ncbi:MAG: antibiotic biosynthesis monooxygenase [Desulfobacula sp.]|jgi:heme-degrading monooxygenase HmoA|uniref:antibiotic biosynthesis monooxygenase family protein n=1 Tax=Desulfobacula sp. TaxID=2593537 RepID=UPI001DA7E82D|nr:antibiotic biosynthesis monooxygenase [Desulfobacula sp.]MBT3487974.1 antibiotic biosynthesis monooxygenase [Desulfobacula sp.]MBT4200605.1 antibiotic biosynthesis monooxygenase [Desulfobacula sp.]MBT4509166.1 antibiotic biosynthesis monooxygenase [Desulfobacula sp.]MBT4873743.1 antibiotic biosynthesis monooxygenase [Desulfobacula sp.]
MAVSIIIKRTFTDEAMAVKLAPFIVQLRSRATVQPGFLTDQTFSCLDCDGEYMIISTWNTLEDWNKWMNSEERMAIQKQIDKLLGEKTLYRYYEPVVGGITPRFSPGPL